MVLLKLKTEKYNSHQNKIPFLINNIHINKIVVSNKVSFNKKGFKYFTGYKDDKRIDLYVYLFQKWVHLGHILIKLNTYNKTVIYNNNKICSQYIYLLVILIDSVFKINKNYYPQVYFKQCKYDVKEEKISTILVIIIWNFIIFW